MQEPGSGQLVVRRAAPPFLKIFESPLILPTRVLSFFTTKINEVSRQISSICSKGVVKWLFSRTRGHLIFSIWIMQLLKASLSFSIAASNRGVKLIALRVSSCFKTSRSSGKDAIGKDMPCSVRADTVAYYFTRCCSIGHSETCFFTDSRSISYEIHSKEVVMSKWSFWRTASFVGRKITDCIKTRRRFEICCKPVSSR